ncbi:MAG: hypothetical protein FJY88_09845 [Candidatus Eisenbacteria bacterium]|nr:hypothetical protein [Candidatus Eisenbacteria bacterium]
MRIRSFHRKLIVPRSVTVAGLFFAAMTFTADAQVEQVADTAFHPDVLVIANALGGAEDSSASLPAFTPEEVEAVHAWVSDGGGLLLIADHAPFGEAAMLAAQVIRRPGVEPYKFGMNQVGLDNAQFALNEMRWLVGERK